jgi:hypothetical protein
MFTTKDLNIFKQNAENIKKMLVHQENILIEPSLSQLKDMENVVFDFIKQYKRKIYGGYAINKHIITKNKADGFYDLENSFADIDFYTPEPIEDCMIIANMFHQKGFKNIKAGEALHKETYTVFVEFVKVCDVSYVPKNVYNRIPFTEIGGINFVSPNFIMIDMLRIVTDPLTSGTFRWEKTIPRICLLQKYYPYPEPKNNLKNVTMAKTMEHFYIRNQDNTEDKIKFKYPLNNGDELTITKMLKYIENYMKNNNDFLLHGNFSYNYYAEASKNKKIDVVTFDSVCFDYITKSRQLLEDIKKEFEIESVDITVVEYYPFWMLYGYSCAFCYKGYPLINIVDYDLRCVPLKKTTNGILVPAYDYNILLALIDLNRARVNKNIDLMEEKGVLVGCLIKFKRMYFGNNQKKTILDDTPFQEFITTCHGSAANLKRETNVERKEKMKKGKLVIWKYEPENGVKTPESTYQFLNSSGNVIRKNLKNLKIINNTPQVDK